MSIINPQWTEENNSAEVQQIHYLQHQYNLQDVYSTTGKFLNLNRTVISVIWQTATVQQCWPSHIQKDNLIEQKYEILNVA